MRLDTIPQSVYSIGLLTFVTIVGVYLYQRKRKEPIPTKWEKVGKITKLHLYPLKSGRRLELEKAECNRFGIRQTKIDDTAYQLRDRSFVIYNQKDNEFRTARTHPKLVLVEVSACNNQLIAFDAPNMQTLFVKIPNTAEHPEKIIRLHEQEQIRTIDCGEEAATWFSKYILEKDSGLRLGFHDATHMRDIRQPYKHLIHYNKQLGNDSTGLYSDLVAMSIINQASVNELAQRLPNHGITVEYFRPTIVVDNPNLEAYAEDNWDWIKIGDVVMRNVKDCTRCMLTTINPETAVRNQDREPLKTLETYRVKTGIGEKQPVMGIYLEVRRNGMLNVGDTVYFAKAK